MTASAVLTDPSTKARKNILLNVASLNEEQWQLHNFYARSDKGINNFYP